MTHNFSTITSLFKGGNGWKNLSSSSEVFPLIPRSLEILFSIDWYVEKEEIFFCSTINSFHVF